jgi:hypothetical protein
VFTLVTAGESTGLSQSSLFSVFSKCLTDRAYFLTTACKNILSDISESFMKEENFWENTF